MDGRSVNQVATELHPVGIPFAAGRVGNYCLLAVYFHDCACKIIMMHRKEMTYYLYRKMIHDSVNFAVINNKAAEQE